MTWTTLQRSKITDKLWGWTGGRGPLLLLIHGVGMRADYWSNIIPSLEAHFSLIVIDMPGHGDSPLLDSDEKTISQYADCIADVLNESFDPLYIAGHSMGALICLDLASRYAESVRGIAVLNGIYDRDKNACIAVRRRADALDGVSVGDPSQTLQRWFGGEHASDQDVQSASQCKEWFDSLDPLGYQQAYRAFAYDEGPSIDDLLSLQCPALFITGEYEPNSTPTMSQSMAELAPRGESHIVDGAKHMMSMTHGDEVTDVLCAFFNTIEAKR